MSENLLNAQPRSDFGKGFARRLRMIDQIPGVFYFTGKENVPLSVDLTNFKLLLKTKPSLIELHVDGLKPRECVIREMQRDPVTNEILHVDFLGIKRGTKVKLSIPVVLLGVPKGVKTGGGILQHAAKELEIECLPKDIPSRIEIDVSGLNIGEAIHVSALDFPAYTFITGARVVVALVVEPAVSKDIVEGAEGEEGEGEGEEENKKD